MLAGSVLTAVLLLLIGGGLLFVSGWHGSDENDTEAAVMARYLIAGGVPEAQILLEDRATSTKENFEYSAEILTRKLPDTGSICFITSDFHIFRSGKLAKQAEIRDAAHLHAPTPAKRVLTNLFREPIVLLKMWLID